MAGAKGAAGAARVAELELLLEQERGRARGAEAALRFREAVIENAADGVCVCHDVPDFPYVHFTVWNRRMVEITGYRLDEINRSGWYQTMYPDPEVQARAKARMDRMRVGDDLSFERWVITRSDGTKKPIAITTSVLVAEDGSAHVLGLMHDLSAQEALAREADLARTDPLTGLHNRRGLEEAAAALFALAAQQRVPITVGFLDISRFKGLNDRLGHPEGDRALRAVAEELRGAGRTLDVVARIGGDEFLLIQAGMTASAARAFFRRLLDALDARCRAEDWDIAFSVGIASYERDRPNLEEALARADALMYQAKALGGSQAKSGRF